MAGAYRVDWGNPQDPRAQREYKPSSELGYLFQSFLMGHFMQGTDGHVDSEQDGPGKAAAAVVGGVHIRKKTTWTWKLSLR